MFLVPCGSWQRELRFHMSRALGKPCYQRHQSLMAHLLPCVTHTLPDCSHSGSWALLHLQEFLDLEMDYSFMTFCFFATSPERKFPESRTSFLLLETTELCLSQIWRTSPPSLAGCQRHIFFLLLYREPPRKDSEMSWEGNFETGKAQFNSVVNHPPIIISCLWVGIFLLWEFFFKFHRRK